MHYYEPFFLCFLLRIPVLGIMFVSLIHFELTFVYDVRYGFTPPLLYVDIGFPKCHLLK